MGRQIAILVLGSTLVLLVAGIILYRPVIRPWHARWGADDAEVSVRLPGDEIVTGSPDQTTRAIDVQVPASAIWPWLVQLGQGRGGFYSYDWLENLAGCDIHSLNSIAPELQNLQVGDEIRLAPHKNLPYYKVMLIDPGKTMVWQSVNPTTLEPGETWGFYLIEKDSTITRLVIRHRVNVSKDKTERVFNAIFEPISFVMEHKMLHGIRDRAQQLFHQPAAAASNP